VRFIGIFDPILTIIAIGWQELRDLKNAVCAATTEGSRHKAHRLTDFEFMLAHSALHHVTALRVGFGISGALPRATTNSREISFLACILLPPQPICCDPIEFSWEALVPHANFSDFKLVSDPDCTLVITD
jgi:hypothetical protein